MGLLASRSLESIDHLIYAIRSKLVLLELSDSLIKFRPTSFTSVGFFNSQMTFYNGSDHIGTG